MNAAPTGTGDEVLEHLSRLARTLTGNDGAEVVVAEDSPGLDGPRLDGNRIVLPAALLKSGATTEVLTGFVDLLAARACFCAQDAIARLSAPVARRLAQTIDDCRACAQLTANYPGATSYLADMRRERARATLERWPKLDWKEKLVWRVERLLWNEVPTPPESSPSLNAALGACDDLLAQARTTTSTSESVRVALGLVDRIRALAAGNVNNMMFSADAHSTLDSTVARNEMEFDEPGSADTLPSSDAASSSAGAVAQTQSDATDQPTGEASPGAPRLSADNHPILSIPITTQFDTVTDLTGKGDPTSWRKLRSAARAQTEPLKAKLERALKADEQTHWKREQERGELDRPSLAKLATSPGYRTPFRIRRVRPGRDAAVSVLIDRSGSMAGRKIELARLCAAALADALTQLGFACEVLGYSSIEDAAMRDYYERWLAAGHTRTGYNRFVEKLDCQVYKRFDSDNLSGLACIECGHENPDGEAVSWAAERLLVRRSHRHILMVLSDGYPATGDGNPAILRTDLRARVDALRERGVELIGVGILDDAVETFYPTSSVVEQLQDLPGAAFSVLGRTLLNHRDRMLETPDA
jgi:cobaltochelatase CobT